MINNKQMIATVTLLVTLGVTLGAALGQLEPTPVPSNAPILTSAPTPSPVPQPPSRPTADMLASCFAYACGSALEEETCKKIRYRIRPESMVAQFDSGPGRQICEWDNTDHCVLRTKELKRTGKTVKTLKALPRGCPPPVPTPEPTRVTHRVTRSFRQRMRGAK